MCGVLGVQANVRDWFLRLPNVFFAVGNVFVCFESKTRVGDGSGHRSRWRSCTYVLLVFFLYFGSFCCFAVGYAYYFRSSDTQWKAVVRQKLEAIEVCTCTTIRNSLLLVQASEPSSSWFKPSQQVATMHTPTRT